METYFNGFVVQCAGTSPSHSTPEGFMGALGFNPLVTAWEMTAWRFSLQQVYQPTLLGHQLVNLRRLLV